MASDIQPGETNLFRYVVWSKWTWISLATTLVFWLYALAISSFLVDAQSPSGVLVNAIVPTLLRNRFSYDLSLNIGTAILVSRIIAALIGYEEHKLRDSNFQRYIDIQHDFYDKRIKAVSESSFRGVYQAQFPEKLISEVLAIGFNSKVIRKNLCLSYKLRDTTPADLGVIVEATAEYDLVNISTEEITDFPIVLAIPNPVKPEMKKYCRFIEYRKNYDLIHIDDIAKEFHEIIENTQSAVARITVGNVSLIPGSSVSIVLVYTMAKETEDTEVVRTGTPTEEMKLTIHDETASSKWIDAIAIHRCSLKDISPPNARRVKEYRLPEFCLPHQGFVWFWKNHRPAPQSLPSPAEPVDVTPPKS